MGIKDPNVIKIGLTADVEGFIKEIKKELSSAKDLGLSDTVKDEIDDIMKMVEGLGKSLSDAMGSKLDNKSMVSFANKLGEEMKVLTKRVDAVEETVQHLVTGMDSVDGSKLITTMQNAKNEVGEFNDTVSASVKVMEDLVNITSKSNGKIQLTDTQDIKVLQNEYQQLLDIKKIADEIAEEKPLEKFGQNIGKTTPLAKALTYMREAYAQLQDARKGVADYEGEDEAEITRLQKRYADAYATVYSLKNKMLKAGFYQSDIPKEVVNSLKNYYVDIDDFATRVETRLKDVELMRSSIEGVKPLRESEVKNEIKVPLKLTTTGRGLAEKARQVINSAEKILENKPLKINFALQSKYSSKKTNDLLTEMQNQIGEIDDAELRAKFQGLYESIAKDFNKEIKLKVTSNIYDEEVKVKRVIESIKKLVGNKIHIFPEFDIKDVDIEKLQKKVDKIAKQLKLNVDLLPKGTTEATDKQLKALTALSETLTTKLDNLNKNYLSQIKKSLADILNIAQELKNSVVKTDAPIDDLVTSVKDLTVAFQKSFGLIEREDIEGIFSRIQQSVKGIRGNLEGDEENPLVVQLKEVISLYREYQRLGGTKSLSEAGGTKKVQKWLADNYVEDSVFVDKGKIASEKYAEGLKDGIPKVEEAASEMAKAALEAARKTQSGFRDLAKEAASDYAAGFRDSEDLVAGSYSEIADKLLDMSTFNKTLSANEQREQGAYASMASRFMTEPKSSEFSSSITSALLNELYESIDKSIRKNIDTFIHSHPTTNAVFSRADIESAIDDVEDGIVNQIVVSFKEIAMLDLSSFSKKDLKDFKKTYNETIIKVFKELTSNTKEKLNSYYGGKLEDVLVDETNSTLNLALDRKKIDRTNIDLTNEIRDYVKKYIKSLMSSDKSVDAIDVSKTFGKDIGKILTQKYGVKLDNLIHEFERSFLGVFGQSNYGSYYKYLNASSKKRSDAITDSLKQIGKDGAYKVAPIEDFTKYLRAVGSYKELFNALPIKSKSLEKDLGTVEEFLQRIGKSIDGITDSSNQAQQSIDKLDNTISETNAEANKNKGDKAFQEVKEGAEKATEAVKEFKEYTDDVAIGLDRINRVKLLKDAGVTNTDALYKLASMRGDLFDALDADDYKIANENPKKLRDYIWHIFDKSFPDDNDVEKLRNRIADIFNIDSSTGFSAGNLNKQQGNGYWTHFATIDDKGKFTDKFTDDFTYKIYGTFKDIADLNKDTISSIMKALSSAGFKGQLKVPGSEGIDSRFASSDQIVIHGNNLDMQKIAYQVLTDLFKDKFSFVSGGFDSKNNSFSEILSGADSATGKAIDTNAVVEASRKFIEAKRQEQDAVEKVVEAEKKQNEIEQKSEELVQSKQKISKTASKTTDKLKTNAINNMYNDLGKIVLQIDSNAKEAADSISRLIELTDTLQKTDSPFAGTKLWSRLNRRRKSDNEDSIAASNIQIFSKAYMATGNEEILNVIKDYASKSNLNAQLKERVQEVLSSALKSIEKGIEATLKEASKTETKVMSTKEYKEYLKKYASWKNSEDFNYNFKVQTEAMQKDGRAFRKITKSGRPGAWMYNVEVPINQLSNALDEVEKKTDKVKKKLESSDSKPLKNEIKSVQELREELTKIVSNENGYDSQDIAKLLGMNVDDVNQHIINYAFGGAKPEQIVDGLMSVYETLHKDEEQAKKTSDAISEVSTALSKQQTTEEATISPKITASLQKKIDRYKELKKEQEEILSKMSAMVTSSTGNLSDSEEYKNLKTEERNKSLAMQALVEKAYANNKANLLELVGIHAIILGEIKDEANAQEQVTQASEKITPSLQKYIDKYKELEKERSEILGKMSPKLNDETGKIEIPENYKSLANDLDKVNREIRSKTEKAFKGWHLNLKTIADGYREVIREQQKATNNLDVSSSSSATSTETKKAADAIKQEGKEAQTSTEKKKKFAKANEKVAKASKKTAEETKKAAEKIKEEKEAAEWKTGETDRNAYVEQMRQASEYAEQEKVYAKERARILKEAQNQQNKYANDLSSMFNKLDTGAQFNKNFTQPIKDDIEKLKKDINDLLNLDNISSSDFKAIEERFNKLAKSVNIKDNILAQETSITGLRAKIANFYDQNTAMSRRFKIELKELMNMLQTDGEMTEEQVKRIAVRFNNVSAEVKRLHQSGQSLFGSFLKQLKSANAQLIATYFSFQDFIRYIREGFNTIVEIDTALTELRKVSDASDERLAQSFKQSTITAKELGATISDVIGVTADWARLGYNVDEAEELARVTTLFKTVGDNMTAEETSSYLISTLQGFQLATDKAEEIADKYNEVANNFAIDTKGIGEALQRSAASFYAANTDLSEAIALVTATNTVVQDPSSVGTLWKTLSARVRGAKSELIELGEEEDTIIESTSKLRDMVKGMTGFDIMEDEETFKSIYDIILGIGKEWNNLTDIQRASLGEALAGKRNANALYAVLNNVETLEKAYAKAEEAQGSAQKEQENYARSIQYSIDVLKASWQEFWTTLIESGAAKAVVDFLTNVVQLLTKITDVTNGLPIFAGAGLLAAFGRNPQNFVNSISGAFDRIVTSLKEVEVVASPLETGIIEGIDVASDGMYHLTKSTNIASGAVSKLSKLIKSPATWGVILGTVAVGAAIWAWNKYNTTVSEVESKIREVEGKISSLNSEISELESLDSLSESQKKRLSSLKEELDIQEKILKIEQQRRATESITLEGDSWWKKFTDAHDEDNYTTKLNNFISANYGTGNYNTYLGNIQLEEDQKEFDRLNNELKDYQIQLDNAEEGTKEWDKASKGLLDTQSKIDEMKTDFTSDYSAAYVDYANLYQGYNELLQLAETVDDPIVKKGILDLASQYDKQIKIVRDYLIKLRTLLGKDTIDLTFDESLKRSVNGGKNELEEYNKLKEFTAGFSDEEKHQWLEITKGILGAQNKIDAYNKSLEKTVQLTEEANPSSILDSVTGMNKRLDAQFSALASAYQAVFTNEDGKEVFDKSGIDNSMLKSIADSYVDAAIELGVAESDAKASAEAFMKAMTDPNVDATKAHEAFNKLATSYFYSADGLKELNEQTAEAIKLQMKGWNIVNAEEVVDEAMRQQKWVASLLDFDQELEREYDKLYDWGYGDFEEQIANKTMQTKFGNVDMDKRNIIIWSKEMKETYKKELESWNYDPELNGIDTVWGGSSPFQLKNGGEVEVAFTPILEYTDEAELLGKETVSHYIQNIINEATDESGELDISKAMQLDETGAWAAEFDEEGHIVGKKFIRGLIAEIGGNAIDVGSLMHFAGESGAIQLAEKNIQELEEAEKRLAEENVKLEDITLDWIDVLLKEGVVTQTTANYLEYYVAAKAASNGTLINTDVSVEALYNLAKEAGLATAQLEVLNSIMAKFELANEYEAKGAWQAANAVRNAANQEINQVKQLIQQKFQENMQIEIEVPKEDAAKSGSESADAWVEAFEKEKEELQRLRDAGLIDEKTYLERYKALIEKYFKDREKYVKNYIDEMKEYLEGLKSLFDSALSGVTTILDKKIDAANKGKDAATKAIEKEKEAVEERYEKEIQLIQDQMDALDKDIEKRNEVIDGLNKQIEAIDKANEARDRSIELQKAEYELQRMKNQRTALVYTGQTGQMRYERDESGVREAQENLKDKQDEILKAKLQDQIDLINKEIEAINKQKDALSKHQEELQKELETTTKYYEKMSKQTEEMWDATIKRLEDQKEKWQEIADVETIANAYSAIQQVFGDLGFTVDQVTEGNSAAFEAFKSKYVGILQEMNTGNQPFVEGLGYAAEQAEKNYGIVGASAESADQIVTGLGTATEQATSNIQLLGQNASTTLLGEHGDDGTISLFNTFQETIESVNKAAEILLGTLKKIGDTKLPTVPSVSATSSKSGKSNALGNPGVTSNVESLVGELGREIVIRDGKFQTVGDKGPEFVNLKKGDIVLNNAQTEEILKKKKKLSGKSFAEGNLPDGFFRLDNDMPYADISSKLRGIGFPTLDGIKMALKDQTDAIKADIKNVINSNNLNTTVNQSNTFNITGVSGEDVARQINTTLVNTFSGMSLNAYQRSMA